MRRELESLLGRRCFIPIVRGPLLRLDVFGLVPFLSCLFAGINGLVFSIVFSLCTSAEVAPAFAAAGGMFGAMVLYGYFTKRDLESLGSLLFMGFVGLLLAMLFNLIWASTTLYWLVAWRYSGACCSASSSRTSSSTCCVFRGSGGPGGFNG